MKFKNIVFTMFTTSLFICFPVNINDSIRYQNTRYDHNNSNEQKEEKDIMQLCTKTSKFAKAVQSQQQRGISGRELQKRVDSLKKSQTEKEIILYKNIINAVYEQFSISDKTEKVELFTFKYCMESFNS